ncbi:unnamed protein product [Paramecium octaurelia]|uniref:Uncharacterized protein n=1 Tax=Paramecium octaurelia TaxID=43137 RepID=A0A8S1UW61_PAROT|nr:unnamed protein product [Paramecium octaurelia]
MKQKQVNMKHLKHHMEEKSNQKEEIIREFNQEFGS